MANKQHCPDCGAALADGHTCEDDFHQMLYWEAEFPEYGVVHHLMVLCYYLQHPHLYSPEGVEDGRTLLVNFVEKGATPQDMRRDNRERLDSGNRKWNISGKKVSGSYSQQPQWTITAADVVANGSNNYVESVKAWAKSVNEALKVVPMG